MRSILLAFLLLSNSHANLSDINSFEADFEQVVKDDKDKVIGYKGTVIATKPQNALWNYTIPVDKMVYINSVNVTIIEPEIEQVMIKKIESDFNLFEMISHAKKSGPNSYVAQYHDSKFTIIVEKEKLKSIHYKDEFENSVDIYFYNQKQNQPIDAKRFTPAIPVNYDILKD
ncbi:MAG: outer-membrane lipoprotein carrier protein LolA [Epsilonproteobacteria bacterium]|nr:outer-membrane lipoprotein carrier protein LolA [Campylobacterota bacterium]